MLASIIIPVYNAENYVGDCLQSILTQTVEDFEVICVDDGSTDSSLEILRSFSETDQRIKVLQQENGGASIARNAGYDVSIGEFVTFVDADDEVAHDFLETLTRAIKDETADIAVANKIYVIRGQERVKRPVLGRNTLEDFDFRRSALNTHVAPHAKLLRRSFLEKHDLRFREGITYEDYLYWLQCVILRPRVVTLEEPLYKYKKNPNSISSRGRLLDPHNLESRLVVIAESLAITETYQRPELKRWLLRRLFGASLFRHVQHMVRTSDHLSAERAFVLLKEGLQIHRDELLGSLRGWKQLAYRLILDGTFPDLQKLLHFSGGNAGLNVLLDPTAEPVGIYVSPSEFPGIGAQDKSALDVSDLLRKK